MTLAFPSSSISDERLIVVGGWAEVLGEQALDTDVDFALQTASGERHWDQTMLPRWGQEAVYRFVGRGRAEGELHLGMDLRLSRVGVEHA